MISGELRTRRKLLSLCPTRGEPALTFGDKRPVSVSAFFAPAASRRGVARRTRGRKVGSTSMRRRRRTEHAHTRAIVRHAVPPPPPLAETVRCAIGGRRGDGDVAIKTMQHAWPPAWNRETKPPLFRRAAREMNVADLCPWLHPLDKRRGFLMSAARAGNQAWVNRLIDKMRTRSLGTKL